MAMTKYPPEYYDCIPFEKHPATSCPCLYHQIDGDALLKEAEDAENFETVERVLKTLLRAGGKTFEAQRTEAQRQEAQRMEVAEQTHWGRHFQKAKNHQQTSRQHLSHLPQDTVIDNPPSVLKNRRCRGTVPQDHTRMFPRARRLGRRAH